MNNEPKLCPLMCIAEQMPLGNICQKEHCMWYRKYADDCAVSLIVDEMIHQRGGAIEID